MSTKCPEHLGLSSEVIAVFGIPISLIKELTEAANEFLQNVDMEILKEKFYAGGFKGRIEIENAEVLFIIREKKEGSNS
jgi:hypothetical protein